MEYICTKAHKTAQIIKQASAGSHVSGFKQCYSSAFTVSNSTQHYTSTAVTACITSYYTLDSLRLNLKRKRSNVKYCWQFKIPNHALYPSHVSPDKPSAVRAELRLQADIFSIMSSCPPALYRQTLVKPVQCSGLPGSGTHWMRAQAEEETLAWQWLGVHIRPAPSMQLTLSDAIISAAELKSALTPPALALQLNFLPFLFFSFFYNSSSFLYQIFVILSPSYPLHYPPPRMINTCISFKLSQQQSGKFPLVMSLFFLGNTLSLCACYYALSLSLIKLNNPNSTQNHESNLN